MAALAAANARRDEGLFQVVVFTHGEGVNLRVNCRTHKQAIEVAMSEMGELHHQVIDSSVVIMQRLPSGSWMPLNAWGYQEGGWKSAFAANGSYAVLEKDETRGRGKWSEVATFPTKREAAKYQSLMEQENAGGPWAYRVASRGHGA